MGGCGGGGGLNFKNALGKETTKVYTYTFMGLTTWKKFSSKPLNPPLDPPLRECTKITIQPIFVFYTN